MLYCSSTKGLSDVACTGVIVIWLSGTEHTCPYWCYTWACPILGPLMLVGFLCVFQELEKPKLIPWATIIQYALPKLLTQIWLGGPFTQRRLNIMQKLRRFFFRDLQRAEDQFTSDVRVLVISGNVAFVILKRRTPEALKLFSCSPPSLFSYTSSLCSMQSSVAKILQALSFPLHRKLS